MSHGRLHLVCQTIYSSDTCFASAIVFVGASGCSARDGLIVEAGGGNDLSVLLSSGFQAAVTTRVRLPLANPSILNIRFGNSTELVLKVTPIAHARCYEVRFAAVGAENAPGPRQTAGMFTNSRSMTIDGLTPGTTYMFQVRAIGGSTRYSDWSNPVSRMCA